jgi:hypothetical protein
VCHCILRPKITGEHHVRYKRVKFRARKPGEADPAELRKQAKRFGDLRKQAVRRLAADGAAVAAYTDAAIADNPPLPPGPAASEATIERAFASIIFARETRRMIRMFSRQGLRSSVVHERGVVIKAVLERLDRDGWRAGPVEQRLVGKFFDAVWQEET